MRPEAWNELRNNYFQYSFTFKFNYIRGDSQIDFFHKERQTDVLGESLVWRLSNGCLSNDVSQTTPSIVNFTAI